ncbi:acyltransferase domain-containing protein [Streptomyces sp. NPDC051940]|uniref:acyltransferase domain-containing protein n=1 Tax=Streptomyces sp. NPDC051940 TaxID=3155675 RepID=UPI00341A9982
MDLRTALLLPGQGAYRPGVFAGPRSAPVAEVLEAVDAVAAEFGRPAISPLLADPDAPDARQLSASDPFSLQLAIFAAALVYAAEVVRRRPADVVLGHSMGEMAAAVHAGCLSVADGARIVAHRARALEHSAAGAGGMLAVTLSARRAGALLGAAELPGARLAVVNAPRHTVLSGPEADLGILAALADVLGVRAVRLPAPYPFHNPLLASAQAEFAAAIADIPLRPTATRLYSPALGELVSDDTDLTAMLVAQLTRPVDFLAALRELQSYGLESVVECGRAGLSELVTAATGCAATPAERWLRTDGDAEAPIPVAPAAAPAAQQAPAPSVAPAAPVVVPHTAVPFEAAPAVQAAGVAQAPLPHGNGVAPLPQAGGVAQPPSPQSPDAIVATLQQIYADRLGYPIEAMDPDADLEGDLGVDSLKRMEILGTLTDRFDLHHVVDDTRFALQSNLAGLARLIAETSGAGQPTDG